MKKKQFNIEQFIGIFPDIIDDELCSGFVKWFDLVSEQNLTMSSLEDSGLSGYKRKDESISIPDTVTPPEGIISLPQNTFPHGLCNPFWKILQNCLNLYMNELVYDRELTSHTFKVVRAKPSSGYHVWHHEHTFVAPYRIAAWHVTLEAPKRGGETEFLHQSMRVKPKVGQLLIWPAGFTHKHRGNPPLEGQKTYITGWFDVTGRPGE